VSVCAHALTPTQTSDRQVTECSHSGGMVMISPGWTRSVADCEGAKGRRAWRGCEEREGKRGTLKGGATRNSLIPRSDTKRLGGMSRCTCVWVWRVPAQRERGGTLCALAGVRTADSCCSSRRRPAPSRYPTSCTRERRLMGPEPAQQSCCGGEVVASVAGADRPARTGPTARQGAYGGAVA